MMTNTNFILIAAIIMVIQHNASGLTCYHCEFGREGCGSPFNAKGAGVIQLNSSSYGYCVKQVYASNTNAISRDGTSNSACSTGTINVAAVTSGSIQDGYTVYCCSTDYCNGASTKMTNLVLGLISVMLSLFFLRK
ncbi:unnamed protein product [Adineta ricciae]|uniref:Uncharacterized protein n=1 Tax=Adineta ricciae TaxID=249248 RepID=A0A815FU11_ADIRI|nr:unnamed protein product [Adineta ricciae]CAF1324955.1 unnamed protein product [Adineta ricciae]